MVNTISGKILLQGLDKCLVEKMGRENLTEREQTLFLLGMRMGNLATKHMIVNHIPSTGAETSYNYMAQCYELMQSGEVWQSDYYLKKLNNLIN